MFHRIRRFSRRRAVRKILRILFRVLFLFSLSLLFVWGALLVLRIYIIEVSFENGVFVSEMEVREEIFNELEEKKYFLPGYSRYFFASNTFASKLEKRIPSVVDVSVDRKFLFSWDVLITGRYLFGTVCSDKCLLVDRNGIPFKETPLIQGVELIFADEVVLLEEVLEPSVFEFIVEIVSYLENLSLPVLEVKIAKREENAVVALESGLQIFISSNQRVFETTRAIHIVFSEVFPDGKAERELSSINLWNPEKITYTSKE